MELDTTVKDRVVLERLISDFTTQLNGAVDFWTVVCLGSMPVNPRAFILDKADRLRSTLVVIGNVTSSSFAQHKLHSPMKSMMADYEQLLDGFMTLERFKSIDFEELRAATEQIASSYHSLRASVEGMLRAIGLEAPDSLTLNPERTAYFDRILNGLFDLACKQRGSAATASPA